MDIKQLIGETTDYDKKVALETKKPKSWCKSISAFANCYGGKLVFGVANDDALVGLSDAEGDAEKISEIIKTHLNPIPEFKLSFEKDNDKTFVIVEVMKGQQTPYYYEGDGQLIAFMRIGNESVPATPSQLRELVLRGSGESYDSLKSRYDFSNMSFTKLKSVYKQRTGNTFEDTDYDSFGLIDEKSNLTNAGALLADESPVRHSRLFCTRWNGLTKASGIVDALDDKEYTGSLVTLLQDGTDFVRNNSKKAWRKVGDGRIEMPDYCERSVFEALVNALIHRDYLINGSEVHVDMFDDRLLIYSPGGMPDGTQIQGRDIDDIPSTRRNPILADIFARLGYMERQGSGLSKIRTAYENAANYQPGLEPTFRSNRVEFTVKLPNLNFKASSNEALNEAINEALNDNQKMLLDMLRNDPTITQKEIIERVSLSRSTVQRMIKELSELGRLERIGSKKTGSWIVKE